ncbi:MAG: hypothetical protein GXP62_08505 [Oligoflexia bacterium]|nr:hypothetical protein [Oligoflexia bacterium]
MSHKADHRDGGVSAELKRQVETLVRDSGIPRPWAWQVARGQKSLNAVIVRLAQMDRVAHLMSRHGLSKSVATQVAGGTLDLEAVLRKARQAKHLADFRDHATLDRALASAQPLTLLLHGNRKLTGRVVKVDAYEFQFQPDGSDAITLHKLQAKLAYPADLRVKLCVAATGRLVCDPIPKPQDRYPCSDRRLFCAHDDGKDSRFVTLEGDEVVGQVAWVGKWEVGVRQPGGAELVVFRHALALFEEA